MRDPARIDPILEAIWTIWVQYPDLRLTQLIVNTVPRTAPCPEVFYYEDSELLKRLQEQIAKLPPMQPEPHADEPDIR